jgi:hypothetical protein
MKMALEMSSIVYLITQRSRGLPPRASFCSLIHLSLFTGYARDAPIPGKLDGSLHTGRDSPTTSKAISLYHDIHGIQIAMRILQWIMVADDFKDDCGSDIPVGMIDGMLSARLIAGS